ncbi:MAG TPA: SDR family oxidoreductase [Sporichthyaceae bacterium]|jgi:NAD(P)-dependent dehydrogenase (short-subunit alcohol dehydrogenase family)
MSSDPLARFRLDGRVAIVTGASSGLGVGFATVLGAVGARVVLAARRADRLHEVAETLRKDGVEVLEVVADVAVPEDCRRIVDEAMATFGAVDVLVNNAGIGPAVPASRDTVEDFRAVIDINLNGAFWMAQAVSAVMAPGSAIVNVASVLGLVAGQYPQASYAASKAGMIGLTRDLAQEWSGRKGIRVNALCPGYFVTELNEHVQDLQAQMIATHTILGRFGEQEELDSALLFLATPASSFVTGTTLAVDGGYTAL